MRAGSMRATPAKRTRGLVVVPEMFMRLSPEELLRRMFEAAVMSAVPTESLAGYLPDPPKGRTVAVGAGKAAAAMARVVENVWKGPLSGLVVTRYGHGCPTRLIEVIEAGHPMPDDYSQFAAHRILTMAEDLTEDDLLLCLISGGGSALMALPAPGLTLDDKRAMNAALLRSGASIAEINCVRKHLSAIKGGRLAAAASPAQIVALIISDVPGDDPSVVASGPTVADPTTYADARAVLRKYGITPPEHVRRRLDLAQDETLKMGDPRLSRSHIHMIATPQDALEAAARTARDAGATPVILGNAIEGEAREVATVMAGIAKQCVGFGQPMHPPCVLLSSGETSVTVRGDGRGGRNGEFLLSLCCALKGNGKIWGLAADTDGVDGMEDNAGAILRPDTWQRARKQGMDPRAFLANNDSYRFFAALDDQIFTGPTRTNVNDFRAVLITA